MQNRVSVAPKKSKIEFSDDEEEGEYDEKAPSYSETLLAIKKWLDIDITESHDMIAPSVFSQTSKFKKSAQMSLALPPAENMVKLWDFKEFEASGISKEVEGSASKGARKNPLGRGQFLSFDRPNMRWYNMAPQPHSVQAPKLQDGFRNITSPQFQPPAAISTPWKQYALWETVNRENINVLNHIYWFNTANCKATEEMEKSMQMVRSAPSENDFENALAYVQECLQMQASINQSLGKALDSLLGTSMTLSANMLLSRRDNYLKGCAKEVTEDDVGRLRNAAFTHNEVFPVDMLSEVQRNFIQWSHVSRDSFKPRRDYSSGRNEEKKDNRGQGRSFRPYTDSNNNSRPANTAGRGRGRGGFGGSRPYRGRGGRK